MSDFGFAVAAVRLVVSCADGQDEVPRVALALSHQEAAVLAFLRQQLLSLPARQVPVEPSGKENVGNVKILDAQTHHWGGGVFMVYKQIQAAAFTGNRAATICGTFKKSFKKKLH